MLSTRPHRRSRLRPSPHALAPRPATAAIGIFLAAAILAACGGGSAATPAASSGAASATPAGSAAPSSAPASAPADTASPAASTGAGTGSGVIPDDPCSVVTRADVEAAFGGSSSDGAIDEDGACAFQVSGSVHAGKTGSTPGYVGVSFSDEFQTYEDEKVVLGDGVTKVEGLGTEAWFALSAVHAKIAGGELVVGGVWVGDFNRDTLKADTITLAEAILSRV